MSAKTNERIFLDIDDILEKGVHESSVCDTGVYRFPNFHIFKQFPFQIPSLSVEGYTKPSAELEINVDVKYVGEDERTDG
jgi:hypothetical protein